MTDDRSPPPTAHPGSQDPLVQKYRPGAAPAGRIPEIGGRKDGSEPVRYGDWEKQGRCIDF